MDIKYLVVGSQAHNIATDLAILCLPQTMIWRMQMNRKSKIAVAFTMLLGGLYDPMSAEIFFKKL